MYTDGGNKEIYDFFTLGSKKVDLSGDISDRKVSFFFPSKSITRGKQKIKMSYPIGK